ncbi:MAG: phenol hydroxylase [Telmatospirillum sp.]|nr:phenol hydroxylase [Telmatospirillum sp.]
MTIDIKTQVIQPKRQTFKHVADRLGGDRAASRYEEATFDLQPDVNFHYRPLWAPQFEQFDRRRTAIVMRDWYDLKDPRQYYYATYNIARARQQEAADSAMEMVERRRLLDVIPADWLETVRFCLLPLRHYEWGANLNNAAITAFGWGAALTAASCFAMGDRLGMAQLLGRIGLLLGGNTETALIAAKTRWVEDPAWQGLRRMVEDSFVTEDIFELFVAQNMAMDAMVLGLVHDHFGAECDRRGATAIPLLLGFAAEWREDNARWVDHVVRVAAAEGPENRALISRWAADWSARAADALAPVATHVLGTAGGARAMEDLGGRFAERMVRLGLA